MKKTVGSADKIIRIIIGIVLCYVAYTSTNFEQWIISLLYIIAAIMFLTAAFGVCPLYSIFKINTRKK